MYAHTAAIELQKQPLGTIEFNSSYFFHIWIVLHAWLKKYKSDLVFLIAFLYFIEFLKVRSHDPEEAIRHDVIVSIVTAAKKDLSLVNDALLNFVKERTLDKRVSKKSWKKTLFIYAASASSN